MTMVERVAWAILGVLPPDASHEYSLKVARAAIAAMRETDERMDAAIRSEVRDGVYLDHCECCGTTWDFSNTFGPDVMSAAIDAALAEEGK